MENEQQAEKEKTAVVRLQCLKCQAEFFQSPSKNLVCALSEPGVYQDKTTEKEHTAGKKSKIVSMRCSHSQVILRVKTV